MLRPSRGQRILKSSLILLTSLQSEIYVKQANEEHRLLAVPVLSIGSCDRPERPSNRAMNPPPLWPLSGPQRFRRRGSFVDVSHTFPELSAYSCGTLRSEMAVPKVLVTRSDEVMSGDVVFTGTRVPVETLLDYLEEGDTLDHFLEDFPTVSREHAVAVLELAKESVFAHADSSG